MSNRKEVDNKNMTYIKEITKDMPDLVNNYITSISSKTSRTKAAYAYYITLFINYMRGELKMKIYRDDSYSLIKPMHIDSYMESIRYSENGKEKSASYRNANLAALKSFFKFLKKNGIVETNPCDETEIPKDNKIHEITVIDKKDLYIMLSNIRNGVGSQTARAFQARFMNRDAAILLIGVTTGLRVSAIVGINIQDINFEEKYILVTEKGNIEKKVFIGDNTLNIIQEWIKDRKSHNIIENDKDALFISSKGMRITTTGVRQMIHRISLGVDKKITPHKMRSTCATRLYEATGDIYMVQQQLGHKNIQNTQRYAKVSESKMRDAANILNKLV